MIIRRSLTIIFFLLFQFSLLCQIKDSLFVPFTDKKIAYEGRTGKDGASAIIYWPGTQIEINFKGSEISAIFLETIGKNYYNLILDNDSIIIFRPNTTKQSYLLVSNLPFKEHNLRIFKRTEWNKGITYFYGFVLKHGTQILNPPQKKKRKLEFYGNSITAGFGVEDLSGLDRPDSTFTNIYRSYAALTARHFNAECSYIVRSGIGIMISWFPIIMPELYDRLDPNDSTIKWNFNRYQPDLVIINLLQNDAFLFKMPRSKEYKYRFGDSPVPKEDYIVNSYIRFVRKIREKYPNAQIICMLGNLSITKKDSPWPAYVERAVDIMNDSRIHTFFVPYKNTLGHPNIEEQKKMAEELIDFIEKNVKW